MSKKETLLTEGDISRLIEMAWEDKTPFEAILKTYQLDEPSLMRLMQKHLKPSPANVPSSITRWPLPLPQHQMA